MAEEAAEAREFAIATHCTSTKEEWPLTRLRAYWWYVFLMPINNLKAYVFVGNGGLKFSTTSQLPFSLHERGL